MSDLHASGECISDSSERVAKRAGGSAARRGSTENTTNDTNNLNSMVGHIQDAKTKHDESFLEQPPDFKAKQARRGTLMQNLWESITGRGSSEKK